MDRRTVMTGMLGTAAAAAWTPPDAFALGLPKDKIKRVRYYKTPTDAAGRPNIHQPTFNQSTNVVTIETESGLIGIGEGDESTPGIGGKSLSDIGPAERTTPAGRFASKLGRAAGWNSVLWVDYSTSVALHAVTKDNKKERRPQRLETPTIEDNRITFGCINVDTSFYLENVKPAFDKGGIVYILPETKSLDEVFPGVRLLPLLKAGQLQTS